MKAYRDSIVDNLSYIILIETKNICAIHLLGMAGISQNLAKSLPITLHLSKR